jgi:hypothetical protein
MKTRRKYGCRCCGHVWYVGIALQPLASPALCGECGRPGDRLINNSDGAHPDSPDGPVGIVFEEGATGVIENGVIKNTSVGIRMRGAAQAIVREVDAVGVPYAFELREQSNVSATDVRHRIEDSPEASAQSVQESAGPPVQSTDP